MISSCSAAQLLIAAQLLSCSGCRTLSRPARLRTSRPRSSAPARMRLSSSSRHIEDRLTYGRGIGGTKMGSPQRGSPENSKIVFFDPILRFGSPGPRSSGSPCNSGSIGIMDVSKGWKGGKNQMFSGTPFAVPHFRSTKGTTASKREA